MNSKKILNVLILIVLFVNIVLFLINFIMYKDFGRLSFERQKKLEQVLLEKNIILDAQLPEVGKMKRIYLSKPQDREERLVDIIFKHGERTSTYVGGLHEHTNKNENLTFNKIAEPGRVFYSAKNPKYKYEGIGIEKMIESFVEDFRVGNERYEIYNKISSSEGDIYFLNEVYEGQNLFCNEIVLKVNKGGIVEARSIRYNPLKFDDKNLEMIDIDEALYSFMYEIELGTEKRINKIEVGYFVKDDIAESGYSLLVDPYYLVSLNNGVNYYINAVTGEILE